MSAERPPIAVYRERFANLPGFFGPEAIACWDFLLSAQTSMKLAGNILEIGVFRGKSALLAACHMAPGQTLVLCDISPIDDVVASAQSLQRAAVHTVSGRSSTLRTAPSLAAFKGTMRWVHIDGDHSGFSAADDLVTAEAFLGDQGIICVDDFFNPRYPQVTAAVYRFLDLRNPVYRMFLCGGGKAWLCRTEDFAYYDGLVGKFLGGHLRGAGADVSVHKSTYTHDGGCFSLAWRQGDLDYVGLDSDPAVIPA